MNEEQPLHPEFLTGWKDIASYLRRAVRTVQRYEIEMGLPVRRPAGRAYGSVVTTKAELDAWLIASPRREVVALATTAWQSEYASLLEVRTGLVEMRKQRDLLRSLKLGLMQSVHVLTNNIEGLHGELKVEHRDAVSGNAPKRRSYPA